MDVAVANELARLAARNREAKAEHHVVEPRFELLQQALARHAAGARRFFKVGAELPFLREVDALGLLLFAELQAVTDDFRLAVFAVLPGREVAFLYRTFVAKAFRPFQEE